MEDSLGSRADPVCPVSKTTDLSSKHTHIHTTCTHALYVQTRCYIEEDTRLLNPKAIWSVIIKLSRHVGFEQCLVFLKYFYSCYLN